MFINVNKHRFGRSQLGVEINEVALPAWAKNVPG